MTALVALTDAVCVCLTVLAFSFLSVAVCQSPAHAQTSVQPIDLPPLHVEAPGSDSCVDVQVGGSRSLSFDCLNQQLKDGALQHADTAPVASAKDVTGTGAPATVGIFSYTGTSIRMGNSFGRSAIPQRPTPPSFTSALVPTGAR